MKPLRLSSPAAAAAMAAALLTLPLAAQTPGPEPAPAPPIVPAQPPVQPPSENPAPPAPALAAPQPPASGSVRRIPATPGRPIEAPPASYGADEWSQSASILEVDCNVLEQRLRRMAMIQKPTPDANDVEPRGPNHFPYVKTLSYPVWGLNVTASFLANSPSGYGGTPRILIQLPFEARSEENWNGLARALGLPAGTRLPPLPTGTNQYESLVIPGPGVNWVVLVHHPADIVSIFIGSRGIYANPQTLVDDKPNSDALAKALEAFSYQALKSRR